MSPANRKLAKGSQATFQLVQLSANEFSINVTTGPRKSEVKFVPGQETERTTMDGRKVKNTFTIEGNKLIERQVEPNRVVTSIKEFSDNELVIENIVGDVKSKVLCKIVE